MKMKTVIFIYLLIFNFLLLPNICLAVIYSNIYVVNQETKICGKYSYDSSSILNYQTLKDWKMIKEGGNEYIEYCQGKEIQNVKRSVLGFNMIGYYRLLGYTIFLMFCIRMIVILLKSLNEKDNHIFNILIKIFLYIFKFSIFFLFLILLNIFICYYLLNRSGADANLQQERDYIYSSMEL